MADVRRAARWLVRVLVSAAIVGYVLVDVDLGDVARALSRVRLAPLLVGVGLFLVSQALSAYKWSRIGRALGFEESLVDYARFYFIGMFFNLFGPSTLGGDLVRALYLGAGRRRRLAVSSVVFDRASGLALLVALGALGFVLFPEYQFPPSLILGTVAMGGALLAGWWAAPRLVRLLPATRWTGQLRREVEVDLAPLWRDRRLLATVALVSVVFHLTQVAGQYVLARAAGARLPFSYCLIFHPAIGVMTALPVSVNGLGVREGGYLYFLTRLDVDDSIAVALSLLAFGVTVFGGLLGGLVFLASGATLPTLRAPASKEAGVAA